MNIFAIQKSQKFWMQILGMVFVCFSVLVTFDVFQIIANEILLFIFEGRCSITNLRLLQYLENFNFFDGCRGALQTYTILSQLSIETLSSI